MEMPIKNYKNLISVSMSYSSQHSENLCKNAYKYEEKNVVLCHIFYKAMELTRIP